MRRCVGCPRELLTFAFNSYTTDAGTWYLNEGVVSGRVPRGAHLSVTPVQTFQAADGWIYVMCMTDRFWDSLLTVIGSTSLRADERFQTQALRLENWDALTIALNNEFKKQPVEHWLTVLRGVLPIAPVLNLKQALDNPFVQEVGMGSPSRPRRRKQPPDPYRTWTLRPSAPHYSDEVKSTIRRAYDERAHLLRAHRAHAIRCTLQRNWPWAGRQRYA